MHTTERQDQILRHARAAGRVEVAALSELLLVTTETIRRDLKALERRGLVRRVHGGALPAERRLSFEPSVSDRAGAMADAKERIARAALEEVPDAGTVLIDAGTTTLAFARLFPTERALTVVTNALPIALQLSGESRVEVHMLGGRVRGTTLAGVEGWALRALSEINVDVAFMATNGVSPERGLTTPDLAEAAVKAAMVAAARRAVLLADHTKVGSDRFAKFADLEQVDLIITDTGLDDEAADVLRVAGPDVVRV